MKPTVWLPATLATLFAVFGASPNPPSPLSQGSIDAALQSIASPFQQSQRWDYVMSVRVRLLLFWIGADDVGGGYILKGALASDASSSVTRLLIGSDPLKAPRKINHWGSAMEIQRHGTGESAFFGFMKSSKAASATEAAAETANKETFAFEANISYANSVEALSRVVPLNSPVELTFRDLDRAQAVILRKVLEQAGPVRRLSQARPGCSRTQGFLTAVQFLVQQADRIRPLPITACYVHNARYYTITLRDRLSVGSKTIEVKMRNGTAFGRTYRDLVSTNFEILNTESGERTRFDLLLGSSGTLRGVPVQIHYQPNWWFQVALNLDTRNSF